MMTWRYVHSPDGVVVRTAWACACGLHTAALLHGMLQQQPVLFLSYFQGKEVEGVKGDVIGKRDDSSKGWPEKQRYPGKCFLASRAPYSPEGSIHSSPAGTGWVPKPDLRRGPSYQWLLSRWLCKTKWGSAESEASGGEAIEGALMSRLLRWQLGPSPTGTFGGTL